MPQLCLFRVHIRNSIAADSGKSIYVTARTATPGDGKFPRLLPVLVGHKFPLARKKPTHIYGLRVRETKNGGVVSGMRIDRMQYVMGNEQLTDSERERKES